LISFAVDAADEANEDDNDDQDEDEEMTNEEFEEKGKCWMKPIKMENVCKLMAFACFPFVSHF